MKSYIPCLSVAGLDPSGGAGVLADIKTFSALGCYGQGVATALTVQNTCGVYASESVSAALITRQLAALFADFRPRAVKIGLLPDADVVDAVAEAVERYAPPFVVVDPVMVSTSGRLLMAADAVEAMERVLLPLCHLLTPNLHEAARLLGESSATGDAAARALFDKYGRPAILLKGGHCEGAECVDVLFDGASLHRFGAPRLATRNTHGTGCALSSAVAALRAQGHGLPEAVSAAKSYLWGALRAGAEVFSGTGHGGMNHFFAPVPLKCADL